MTATGKCRHISLSAILLASLMSAPPALWGHDTEEHLDHRLNKVKGWALAMEACNIENRDELLATRLDRIAERAGVERDSLDEMYANAEPRQRAVKRAEQIRTADEGNSRRERACRHASKMGDKHGGFLHRLRQRIIGSH